MACRFEVTLSSEDAGHVGTAREALDEIDRLEAILSVFRDTSEIVRVNRLAADGPVPVGEELFELLDRCRELSAATGGAFDCTSTPISRCWGFLKREGRLPDAQEIDDARSRVGMDKVVLDAAARSVAFTRPGVELNFGAIGKGYALDRIGALVRERGLRNALLSAGGSSVLALGGGQGFSVDVRPLLAPVPRLARVRLRDAALGTSGAGEQSFQSEGRRYGHVLDPRTGRPAEGVLSVSVVAREAAAADALSTAFLVGGCALAEACCAARPDTLALVTLETEPTRPRVFGRCEGVDLELEVNEMKLTAGDR